VSCKKKKEWFYLQRLKFAVKVKILPFSHILTKFLNCHFQFVLLLSLSSMHRKYEKKLKSSLTYFKMIPARNLVFQFGRGGLATGADQRFFKDIKLPFSQKFLEVKI